MTTEAAPRIPKIGHLEHTNRQQMRRIATSHINCYRCGQQLQVWHGICFDDGKDSHTACSLERNRMLHAAAREFAEQDARDKGTTRPVGTRALTKRTPMRPRVPAQTE